MRLLLLLLLLALAIPAQADTVEGIPNPRKRGSWVTDSANLLSPEAERRLDAALTDLEAGNGCEVAVVTIQDTDGREPKPFATDLFNRWGVGKRGADNGVLFLVVVGRRRVEIEVGDGVRTVLSDGRSQAILDQQVVPRFKSGNFEAGIEAGIQAVVAQLSPVRSRVMDRAGALDAATKEDLTRRLDTLAAERGVEAFVLVGSTPASRPTGRELYLAFDPKAQTLTLTWGPDLAEALQGVAAERKLPNPPGPALVKVVGGLETRTASLSPPAEAPPQAAEPQPEPQEPRQPEPEPEEAGGLPWWLPGGGAVVLVGGAYAGLRYRPRRCPACQVRMARLDEVQDDAHLTTEEQLEERIGSVDYDVWQCRRCGYSTKIGWQAWLSSHSRCPSCHRKTMTTENETVREATTSSSGEGRRTENCCNCSHHETTYYTIAQLPEPSSSSSDSSSSSSSFSSSSDFGGGSSSGGGAGASW